MGKTYRRNADGEYQDKDRRNTKPSRSCLNGGSCDYCQCNRRHSRKRQAPVEQWDYESTTHWSDN